jgi:choline dehydrogenase-like flavoprotein
LFPEEYIFTTPPFQISKGFRVSKMASADIIIVGGGISGCVLASRLHEKFPSFSILLIEAGPNISNHPLTKNPEVHFQHSELDWDYKTVPQVHLNNRICFGAAGKALSGGSAINACKILID